MFRGPIVFATLVGVAQSDSALGDDCTIWGNCAFDVAALEEFSVDYNVVVFTEVTNGFATRLPATGFVTSPLPDTFPSEHGSIALHARNLQLKLDSHATFPNGMPAIGGVPFSGMEIHEELHINGATGQASFHLASPVLNLCFQVDGLPPVAQIQHDMIDHQLQQAEQMVPVFIQDLGRSLSVDGEPCIGTAVRIQQNEGSAGGTGNGAVVFLFTENTTHPKLVALPLGETQAGRHLTPELRRLLGSIALKFDNYADSVGNQFSVRACEVESHTSTQSLLASNPDAREFVQHRVAQHQRRLQALLEPVNLNTRFNFIPLEISDLMVPAAQPCTNEELAQVPGTTVSTLQAAAFIVCSFVMAVVVTSAAMRKKTVTPAGIPLLQEGTA